MGNYTFFDSRFPGGHKEIYGIKGKRAEALFLLWRERGMYGRKKEFI